MGPKDCVLRIQKIAKVLNSKIPLAKKNSAFNCPATMDLMTDTTVLNCGHIFKKTTVEWVMHYPKKPRIEWVIHCPSCRENIETLRVIPLFKNLIDEWQKEECVPTLSHFKKENRILADKQLQIAKIYEEERDYKGAVDAYSKAFLYTNRSEDYLALPLLYEKLGQEKEFALACLHLALRELEEGKIEEAVKTLQWCKIDSDRTLKIDALLVALTLEENPSQEQIQEALSIAADQTDPKEAICIYKQILAVSPRQFEAYTALCLLLKQQHEEKNYLLLKAADYAEQEGKIELAAHYREEAMRCNYPNTISQEDWANPAAFLAGLPPMPQALSDFLEGSCPIYPGKQAKETHFVVPFTKNLTTIVDGNPVIVPRTLKNLDQFDKDSGGTGCRDIWNEILKPENNLDTPPEIEFEWLVMTKDVLPGSRNIDYASQKRLVEEKSYQVPGFLEAATCILWAKRCLGTHLYSGSPRTFTRCHEKVQGCYLIVGGFTIDGLGLSPHDGGLYLSVNVGVGGLRKF